MPNPIGSRSNPDWQNRLEPFADIYSEAEGKMKQIVELMDEGEVEALIEATGRATLTNCPFPILQVIGPVRNVVNELRTQTPPPCSRPTGRVGGIDGAPGADAEGHVPGLGTFPYREITASGGDGTGDGRAVDRFIEVMTAKKGLNPDRFISLMTTGYGFDPERQVVLLSRQMAERIGLDGVPEGEEANLTNEGGIQPGGVIVNDYLEGDRRRGAALALRG